MNSIMRFFFTIYASLVFMIWIFIAYLSLLFFTLFFGQKKDKLYLKILYRFFGKAITWSCFMNVKKVFHSSFDERESYVVVSNHQTMMDILANVNGAPKEVVFKFLGKQEADRVPFFGYLINRLFILVDRKSEASRKTSFVRMKREMEKGYSIIIYPEGTRNRTPEPIKEFYDGAFRLAIEMQKPILVNTLVGIRELNPPTGFFTYLPGKLYSHWDTPISTIGMTLEDIPKLKKKVGEIMIARLEEA